MGEEEKGGRKEVKKMKRKRIGKGGKRGGGERLRKERVVNERKRIDGRGRKRWKKGREIDEKKDDRGGEEECLRKKEYEEER